MTTPGRTPAFLRWATVLLAVDTAGVWAYVAYLVYADLTRTAEHGQGTAVTVYFALFAVMFAVVTVALARRQAWARGLAIVLQLMLAAVGYYMIQGDLTIVGVVVLLLAVTGVVLLLAPSSREGLGAR